MSDVSINPPKTPVTTGSNTVASVTVPNVCKMPGPPPPFVPTALPNVARSKIKPKGFSKTVKIGGRPVAIRGASFGSTGDAASKSTGGGLVSSNTHGPAKFIGLGSLDVKIEGKNVHLLGDPMLNNCDPGGGLPNSGTLGGARHKSGIKYVRGKGDPNCPHPKMERSDPAENAKKKRQLEDARLHEQAKKERLLRRADKLEEQGHLTESDKIFKKALAAENQEAGIAWEQKVAKDTNAREQSIDYYCPDCGMEGELDCITDEGVIKEAKITGKAAEASQYIKHRSAAAALFPGAPVHVAVPAKEARKVTPAIPRSGIQRH
jgi:uncharacterized Zn-binding protein involved in type VI secretion